MGGAETEISFSTKNVLIECAWFEPIAVRRAARALKLHTEASTRFGRGADPEMAEAASRRAAELILQLAGGELLSGVVDVYPGRRAAKKITVTRAEILRLMGADVPDKEVEREIDLIEEIARVYGLEKFPPRLPAARTGAARLPQYEAEARLRERLIGLGYREIVTIPHVDEQRDELFRPESVTPAKLANPLSEEAGVLRSTGSVTMAAAIEWNLNHSQRSVKLFEIGKHYRFSGATPVETPLLSMGATGVARPQGLYDAARDYSFADLKGDLDAIGAMSGGIGWQDGGPDWLNAAKRGKIFLKENELGAAGLLAKRVAEKYKFRQDVFLAEIALGPLYCAYYGAKNARRYEPLPRFPAVERDFSLLLADGVKFANVTKAIEALGIAEIRSIEAADLFRGKNVPAGKYSLMVRVTLQSKAATLTDAQIAEYSAKIVAALESELGATLRAS